VLGAVAEFERKMAPEMKRLQFIIDEVLHSGWSVIETDPESSLLEVASDFGQSVPSRVGGPVIDLLKVLPSQKARSRSLSGIYGQEGFPWHTDMAHIRCGTS
jgi:hypothetical protein